MFATILHLLAAGQAAAAPAPAQSSQQLFDQASRAAAEGKCADAIRDFGTLEARPRSKPNPLLSAAIDVRKGGCLIAQGHDDEGETAIRRGLPALLAAGDEFAVDMRDGYLALGGIRGRRFDYAGAAVEYRHALEKAQGLARVRPLMGLAQVLTFDGDGEALRYAAEARSIALAETALDKDAKAAVQTQYARVLLNQGRHKEAYAELKQGLQKQGGLTTRVGIGDVVTRSDLAIAAMLDGDKEGARRYLAYTGAGRMKDTPFARAASMQPPLCGSATGLKPEDFAIVEFSVLEDGSVGGVVPVYTTGGREVALAFAQAVSEWSWRPEDVQKIPPLFRYTTRVELRCTRVGERPDLVAPVAERFSAWLGETGQQKAAWWDMPDARAIGLLRPAVAQARSAGDRAGLVQALAGLGTNEIVPATERAVALQEAEGLASQLQAPAAAQTFLAIQRTWVDEDDAKKTQARFRSLLASPAVAGDPLSAATLRMLIAAPRYGRKPPEDASTLLNQVIEMPGLPAQHPLKVNAMLQQANLLAEKNDLVAARAVFERTGLTEEQCALIGLTPAMQRSGVSISTYPQAAVQMGFEGWTRTEFDVAADGRTIEPRVIAAYPPFVFDEAATGVSRGARFESSYRPNGGLACSAQQTSISFKLAS
ncbi:energy transducer TonB [Sphingomonas sp. ac-8]|uniref:energy transducer TonB n=1 Tax=Sphingomonas sp. ac-8 TaxID=3242977 RepID=UPI003A80515E